MATISCGGNGCGCVGFVSGGCAGALAYCDTLANITLCGIWDSLVSCQDDWCIAPGDGKPCRTTSDPWYCARDGVNVISCRQGGGKQHFEWVC